MGDHLICELSGAFLEDNFQPQAPPRAEGRGGVVGVEDDENFAYSNLTYSLKTDLARYFSACRVLDDAATARIVIRGRECLQPRIAALIDRTLSHCRHLFEEINCGYDIICSMYIHLLISVYSNRTVYDALLFKCTKNKRLDTILKRMRQTWMSIMLTSEPSGGGALC